ncbi:4-phosphopantetheinyl transferase family protein [Polaribacter batillariae]|uniref:4-phosphopantetheinyl transferase family protein n=1 Tax=Polaribacter batillariae TaxID=2808900 RepID=A0ABX7SQM8_9FLAO|nr:4'-phosphopantetheinyl transferase superfamily protein [Polaribacter batillariae]QTD36431.1 4-phosphopantetheinyl transferase family protein [Polaribacter batillariae]
MINIGNDIVDLNLAKTKNNWQRKGFLEKQFTKNEQEIILNVNDSFLQVWQFWSMKEAAYKCYTQKVEKRFFAPKKFECNLISKDEGMVVFEDIKFYTTTVFNEFYLHTISKNHQEKVVNFFNIGFQKTIDSDVKLKLAEETGIALQEIKKRKSIIGVPNFYQKGKKLTQSCSISHHGNYGAFAFTLENEFKTSTL